MGRKGSAPPRLGFSQIAEEDDEDDEDSELHEGLLDSPPAGGGEEGEGGEGRGEEGEGGGAGAGAGVAGAAAAATRDPAGSLLLQLVFQAITA